MSGYREARRQLRVSDILLLVAATALGLAICKWKFDFSDRDLGKIWIAIWSGSELGWYERLTLLAHWFVSTCDPILTAWCAGIVALRLVAPRPGRRRMWCQPGLVACAAALIPIGTTIGRMVIFMTVTVLNRPELTTNLFTPWGLKKLLIFTNNLMIKSAHPGQAVFVAWILLWVGGRWHPEPSWIDRAGRALGIAWIVAMLLYWFVKSF